MKPGLLATAVAAGFAAACGGAPPPERTPAPRTEPDAAATEAAPPRVGRRDGARASAACRPPAAAHARWSGDFETGDLSQWVHVQSKRESRIRVVASPRREGVHAARVEVHPEDADVAGSRAHHRAELVGPRIDAPAATEQWWLWSTYFEPGFTVPDGGWVVFTQLHTAGDGLPNVTLSVGSERRIDLGVRGGDAAHPSERFLHWAGPIVAGRWYDFALRIRWSPTSTGGLIQLCVNGRLAVPPTRAPTVYRGRAVYFKQGLYRSRAPRVVAVYHDGAALHEVRRR